MNYTLEYRYPDGCDGVYAKEDLTKEEKKLLDELFRLWGLNPEDRPSEVAIVLED